MLLRLALFALFLGPPATAHASDDLLPEFNYDTDTTFADGIAVADFDDDGEVDVARATRELGDLGIVRVEVTYSSQLDAVFRVYSNEPIAVSAADVDRDGDPDLLFGSAITGATAGVWLNDGAGDLAPAEISVAPVHFKSRHSLDGDGSRVRPHSDDAWWQGAPDIVGWDQCGFRSVCRGGQLRATSYVRSTSTVWSPLSFRGPPQSFQS